MTDGESPLLTVEGLEVRFGDHAPAVRGVDLTRRTRPDRRRGRRVGIREVHHGRRDPRAACRPVVESRPAASLLTGSTSPRPIAGCCGRSEGVGIGYVPQDPMTNLNPVWKVGFQIREALRANTDGRQARRRAVELLAAGRHAGSGEAGRQVPAPIVRRHVPACADRHRAGGPAAAADRRRADVGAGRHRATPGARPPAAPHRRAGHRGAADHPRPGAGRRTGRALVVVHRGVVVESGAAQTILRDPQHAYTQRLVAAAPSLAGPAQEARAAGARRTRRHPRRLGSDQGLPGVARRAVAARRVPRRRRGVVPAAAGQHPGDRR